MTSRESILTTAPWCHPSGAPQHVYGEKEVTSDMTRSDTIRHDMTLTGERVHGISRGVFRCAPVLHLNFDVIRCCCCVHLNYDILYISLFSNVLK